VVKGVDLGVGPGAWVGRPLWWWGECWAREGVEGGGAGAGGGIEWQVDGLGAARAGGSRLRGGLGYRGGGGVGARLGARVLVGVGGGGPRGWDSCGLGVGRGLGRWCEGAGREWVEVGGGPIRGGRSPLRVGLGVGSGGEGGLIIGGGEGFFSARMRGGGGGRGGGAWPGGGCWGRSVGGRGQGWFGSGGRAVLLRGCQRLGWEGGWGWGDWGVGFALWCGLLLARGACGLRGWGSSGEGGVV